MGVRRTCLEIGIRNQIFLEKPEVGILIPITWIDSCNDSFLPVWNSHCTRVRFTVVVSCSDELAVHSCPLLCLQRWVAKVASRLFCCWSLLRYNNMATNLQRFTLHHGSRRFVAWDCWTQAYSWQVMQRDSDMLTAVGHVHLYFVKRSTSESIAVVLKVVDIVHQRSIGPSKGSINSHGSIGGHWMARGSMTNFWGVLEQWSLQFKIIVNRARNANGVFQELCFMLCLHL